MYLSVSGGRGEVYAMALKEQLDAPGSKVKGSQARTALSKIQKAYSKDKYGVRLTDDEAEQLLNAIGYYIAPEEFYWAPKETAYIPRTSTSKRDWRAAYPGIEYREED